MHNIVFSRKLVFDLPFEILSVIIPMSFGGMICNISTSIRKIIPKIYLFLYLRVYLNRAFNFDKCITPLS